MAEDDIVKLVTVGRAGWRFYYGSASSMSGYGGDIATTMADLSRHGHRYAEGCLIVDTTAIPDGLIGVFAISGPMVDPDLEPNTVRKLASGTVPWEGAGDRVVGSSTMDRAVVGDLTPLLLADPHEREAMVANPAGSVFGNASGFDHVSVDVYATIAERLGALVLPVEEAAAQLAAGADPGDPGRAPAPQAVEAAARLRSRLDALADRMPQLDLGL